MRVLLCLALLLSAASLCAQDAAVTKRFNELLSREWEYRLKESPTFASYLGDKRYNDRWPDVSLAAISHRHEHQKEVLAELDTIDSQQLSANDQLNWQLFRKEISEEIEEYPFHWHLAPLDHRGGIQTENELADALSFTTVKDYEDWIARLRTLPKYIEQTTELMREGIKERIVQPKIVMRRLPGQIEKQIVDEPTESLYYKPFKSFPPDIAAADQERLKREASAAIRDQVVPAYRAFKQFFDEEYFPACFGQVGAWQLPRGDEFYAIRARHLTTTKMTPSEIHEIGLKEVARIRREMEAIVEQLGFKGSFHEFLDELRTNKKFYYDTPEELLTGYLALCKRIDPQLTKLFHNLPRIPYGIEAVPQNIAPDTTTAYYRPPSADGSRAGTFFVNL
jgi:prolyl oligopeptidase